MDSIRIPQHPSPLQQATLGGFEGHCSISLAHDTVLPLCPFTGSGVANARSFALERLPPRFYSAVGTAPQTRAITYVWYATHLKAVEPRSPRSQISAKH